MMHWKQIDQPKLNSDVAIAILDNSIENQDI